MPRTEIRNPMCRGSWCVLLWGHMAGVTQELPHNAAVAGGVPSSIIFFKGGGEGRWSRNSKSSMTECLGQLVLMDYSSMYLYGLGARRS